MLSGRVEVQTDFYDPVTLEPGQAIYIDSSMGHAYLAATGCEEAEVLAVMSSAEEELMESLLTLHHGQLGAGAENENDAPASARDQRGRGEFAGSVVAEHPAVKNPRDPLRRAPDHPVGRVRTQPDHDLL